MKLNELLEPEKPDPKPSITRKVVVWGREDLLSKAVGLFLEAGMTWDVIRVSGGGNIENLIRKIKRVKPDVVILCQDRINGDLIIPFRVLDEQPSLKVITLSLENNSMQVYSKKSVIVQGVKDLLSIIEPVNSSGCIPGKEV